MTHVSIKLKKKRKEVTLEIAGGVIISGNVTFTIFSKQILGDKLLLVRKKIIQMISFFCLRKSNDKFRLELIIVCHLKFIVKLLLDVTLVY